ncbi:MAG: hypothetical protein WCO33_01275 [bacterium]
MLIFDPVQLKSFGHEFFETETFSVRYVLSKKLIFKSIYIPYGPIIKNEKGYTDFMDFLVKGKFVRIKIDLPKIYLKESKEKLEKLLIDFGFESSTYVQDKETLVLTPTNWNLSSKDQRYIRNAVKEYSVRIYTNLDPSVIHPVTKNPLTKDIYNVYAENGRLMHYNIKSYEAFLDCFKNSLTSVSYNNTTDDISGFVLGYPINSQNIDNLKVQELLILFTALSPIGKENRHGYLVHQKLFEYVFNELKYDSIDFHGADRSKGRSYVEFKERFGGSYLSYPGSFEYKKYFK